MTATLDDLLPAPARLLPRDHLSASSIGTFARCPEQFRRRYMLGEKERPAAALLWGGADGATFEHNFRLKIDTHEDLPEDDLKLLFAENLDERVERDGGPGEVDWGKTSYADVKDQGVQLVAAYRRVAAPAVQPIAVEQKIEHLIAGVPVPIIGYIDIAEESRVIEAKTSARAVSAVKDDWRMQGRIYQAATRQPIQWHVKVKAKTPAVLTGETLAFPYSDVAVAATENRIRGLVGMLLHLIGTYGPDEPWPSSAPDSWANVCGFCGFRPTCAHWAGS